MRMRTLKDLYVRTLQELHATEKHQRRILPEMARAAFSRQLRAALEEHKTRTDQHLSRIESVLKELGVPCREMDSEDRAFEGLLAECLSMVHEDADPHVRDAALVALAQRVAYAKLAEFECAKGWGAALLHHHAVTDFGAMMDDEKRHIDALSALGARINTLAMIPGT